MLHCGLTSLLFRTFGQHPLSLHSTMTFALTAPGEQLILVSAGFCTCTEQEHTHKQYVSNVASTPNSLETESTKDMNPVRAQRTG